MSVKRLLFTPQKNEFDFSIFLKKKDFCGQTFLVTPVSTPLGQFNVAVMGILVVYNTHINATYFFEENEAKRHTGIKI